MSNSKFFPVLLFCGKQASAGRPALRALFILQFCHHLIAKPSKRTEHREQRTGCTSSGKRAAVGTASNPHLILSQPERSSPLKLRGLQAMPHDPWSVGQVGQLEGRRERHSLWVGVTLQPVWPGPAVRAVQLPLRPPLQWEEKQELLQPSCPSPL